MLLVADLLIHHHHLDRSRHLTSLSQLHSGFVCAFAHVGRQHHRPIHRPHLILLIDCTFWSDIQQCRSQPGTRAGFGSNHRDELRSSTIPGATSANYHSTCTCTCTCIDFCSCSTGKSNIIRAAATAAAAATTTTTSYAAKTNTAGPTTTCHGQPSSINSSSSYSRSLCDTARSE